MPYTVATYRDQDTGRERFAVLDTQSRVFYFAARYGRKAAQVLADRLNKEAA